MNIAQPSLQPPRYLIGIAISLALHALLIVLWQALQPQASVDEAASEMRLMRVRIVPEAVEAPQSAVPLPSPSRAPRQAAQAAQRAATSAAAPASAEPAAEPPAESSVQPTATPSLPSDLLARAKAAAGGIDRALRQESPRRGIQAPVVTAAMKLERGIARAAELAPNKWYQAPKTEEIIDPGGYGRRRYRVTTALGTYCVTYESNHAPDGIDSMQHGIKPKKTNCEEAEQPATFQKWN